MKIFIYFSVVFISSFVKAETLSLNQVWKSVSQNSQLLASAHLQKESVEASQKKASRHWLPRIYIDAKGFQTNDPGSSFIGLLEQRSLMNTDFNPDTINNPKIETYLRGALGLDLPLYEGGFKSSQSEALSSQLSAQDFTLKQTEIELYSQVSTLYAQLALNEKQSQQILNLKNSLEKIMKNYQLGQRSNPIGYSALLGMKSLLNRLNGLNIQIHSKNSTYLKSFEELGLDEKNWKPLFTNSMEFVNQNLSSQLDQKAEQSPSNKNLALQENVLASKKMVDIQTARFLPRVGAFAEGSIFKSERDTADSYVAGLYLQWNLFDPSDFGSRHEFELKSQALQKQSEFLSRSELAERNGLSESLKALKENISLIQDSQKNLDEQTKISESLFRNGSINAIQLVEIFNRRTDLVTQQTDIEIQYIQAAAKLITLEDFKINTK